MSDINAKIEALDGMGLKELQAEFEKVTGAATRVPNKVWLVRKLTEALQAATSAEGGTSAPMEQTVSVEEQPGTANGEVDEVNTSDEAEAEESEGVDEPQKQPQEATSTASQPAQAEAESKSDEATQPESGLGAEEGAAGQPKPMVRDPRLPPVGTVLVKRSKDGTERCRCTLTEQGVEYAGKLYGSISAAGAAAASDLGLKGAVNGFIFWGLAKTPPAKRSAKVNLDGLAKRWDRYIEDAREVVSSAKDEAVAKLKAELEKHQEALAELMATLG